MNARRASLFVAAVFALGLSNGTAFAAGAPASPRASCVATITTFEAAQLPPGSIGREASALATSAPGIFGTFVSGLASVHAGSFEACAAAAG